MKTVILAHIAPYLHGHPDDAVVAVTAILTLVAVTWVMGRAR
jgi:hypothetical protein